MDHKTIWTSNIRGLLTNLTAFQHELLISKPDIIILCETFLTASVPDCALSIPNYSFLRRDRESHGGGVIVYHKNSIQMKRLSSLESPQHEAIWFKFPAHSMQAIACAAYWPPCPSNDLTRYLQNTLDSLHFANNEFIIISGDLNAHHTSFTHSSYTNASGTALRSFICDNDLTQVVTSPTRITGTSASCIDILLTNVPDLTKFTRVIPGIGTSDHAIAITKISNYQHYNDPEHNDDPRPTWYDCSSTDWQRLNDYYHNINWEPLLLDYTIDEAWDNFKTIYNEGLRLHARATHPNRRQNTQNTQLTLSADLMRLRMKMRNAWTQHATHNHRADTYREFSDARRCYTAAIKREKRKNDDQKIRKMANANNSKAWYRYCKSLYHGANIKDKIHAIETADGTYTEPEGKANALNEVFTDRASNVIQHSLPRLPLRTSKNFDWIWFGQCNVEHILKHLNPNKAAGPDNIQNDILKNCASSLCVPLAKFFKRSFLEGTLPKEWKLAAVIPVYKKKGSRSDPTNYRPISLTSSVCKVMERVINDELLHYLLSNELLTNNQFGFLPGHSTNDQLSFLLHELHAAANHRKVTLACFLDLAAAFDTVPHAAILHKLPTYGIRGHLFQWISNFLSQRQQFVYVDGSHSSTGPITSGVPQGSVIAPTLFILFMNDLSTSLTKSNTRLSSSPDIDEDHLMYADDTMLYCSGSNATEICDTINTSLSIVNQWARTWGMKFNPHKTNAMCFGPCATPPDLMFSDHPVAFVPTHKHLGFTISSDLSFRPHVDTVCRKVATQLFLLRRMSLMCNNSDTLNKIYKSFILPLFEYASPAWIGLSCADRNRLESLQRRAIRIILHLPYMHPIADHDYAASSIHPLQHRRIFASLCIGYKLINNLLPRKLNNFIPHYCVHPHQTRNPALIIPRMPLHSMRVLDKSPICIAVHLLNKLSVIQRNSQTLSNFKDTIKDLPLSSFL